jgi:hypothetical protein
MRAWLLVVLALLILGSGIAVAGSLALSAQPATGADSSLATVSSSAGTVTRQGTIVDAPTGEQLEQRSAQRFQAFFGQTDHVQERTGRTTDGLFEALAGADPANAKP